MARSQRPTQPVCKRPAASGKAQKPKQASGKAASPEAGSEPSAKRRKLSQEVETKSSKKGRKKEKQTAKEMDMSRRSDASNSPSEDTQAHGSAGGQSARQHPGLGPGSELGGPLSFFMKRGSNQEGSDGSPGSGLFMGFGSSLSQQFAPILRDLRSEDGQRQLTALTDLAHQLSFSSEEALISFPMETFIPLLVNLLGNPGNGDETTAQVMLLSCRCLFNVVDILPPTARLIVGAGGLPVLCANLLNIEYIDVAELTVSIIEQISEDQPLQVIKAGGLEAILTFLDFFQMSVQRQAANAAALMLMPALPTDVFEQYVKPVLPTLAQLLQHSDPQVLQSICECWRRVIDGAISGHERPKGSSMLPGGLSSPSAVVSRFASQARMRFNSEGSKRDGDEDEEDDDEDEEEEDESGTPLVPPSPAGAPVSAQTLAITLQEIVPSSVLGNLILLLGNGISSPTPQSSVVVAEVLYILSVLTNYSDNFAKEVLGQDICSLLRQMVLGMDLVGGVGSASQASSGLLRVLAMLASLLPSVQLTQQGCNCEENRLAVMQQHPEFMDALSEAFLPLLLGIWEASMDPSVQSLCISLLLTFCLASQSRPELLSKHLEPSHLSSFMASLLLAGASSSVTLSSLLIAEQLLLQHPDAYTIVFIRQGVLHAIQGISQRQVSMQTAMQIGSGDEKSCNLWQLNREVAQRVIANHLAPAAENGETEIMRQLRQAAQELQSDPEVALTLLRELVRSPDGVTAFELTCSGTATALCSFLFPAGGEDPEMYRERLRIFLEHFVNPPGGSLMKLVRLCVSALQRTEHEPLTLFPTQASPASSLPRHLQLNSQLAASERGRRELSTGLMRLGSSGRGQSSGASSPILSVLRLLAKPVKIRMGPHGSQSSSMGASLPNFRALLSPFSGNDGGSKAEPEAPPAASGSDDMAGAASRVSPVSASPAARLRNYLASKVSRRGMPIPSVNIGRSSVFRSEQKSSAPSSSQGDPPEGEGGHSSWAASSADEAGRFAREDHMAEALEAVLLVEPFAQISALEDYIWDRHGPGKASATPAGAEGGESGESSARVRLTVKQPPPHAKARAPAEEGASAAPNMPMSPPAVPVDAPLVPPPIPEAPSPTSASAASASAAALPRKQTVRIYHNGTPVSSKTSVVQVLVGSSRAANSAVEDKDRSRQRRQRTKRAPGSRFLANVEDSSGSDDDSPSRRHASSRQFFCGSIWARVHTMTYELLSDPLSPSENEVPKEEPPAETPTMIVPTDFDCLVQCHARVQPTISGIHSERSGVASGTSEAEPFRGREILELLSAFHNIFMYTRSMQVEMGASEDEQFHCNSLTSVLLRQLSDPLAVCTGSIPSWCPKLAGACRFLLPHSVRRILHHSCNLGLGRALHHVQQRAVAQHATSQEAHRRLEGEVSVGSVPRQKVRISRQRLMDSAVKVMNLYGAGTALLEVEYAGEVGTGSGPTLEFYAQVADALRNSDPCLFRKGTPGGMIFPEPYDQDWLRGEAQAAQQILERFRLLGHMVAKCILDNRLMDIQLHPAFWRSVLGYAPLSLQTLRSVDPEIYASLENLRNMESDKLEHLCVDFTLPGHAQLELKPQGVDITLNGENLDEYLTRVTEVSLVEAVASQISAFRTAFRELLPLETCRIWSEQELSSIIIGSSVRDDTFWSLEHLSSSIKAQHGYTAESRCFRDLLAFLSELNPESRRNFLLFATGAPTLPIGGFGGLKPPLTVVKKETPPAPLTPDQFMPSVMTCANYLKLPEYSNAEILKQKVELAMQEGQSAFLLS
mmetsp:Transcript_99855/g.177724  ORF Transcript_99855/g.177724 Transcript_99855/m.177724 type:complete len:1782 (+) Transcript_99855:114-5459(+)